MSPVQVLTQLLKIDPGAARVLFAGMGFFAAASIVLAFSVDLDTAIIVGDLVVAMGALLQFLSFIPGDVVLKRLIAWLLTIFIFAVLFTLFFSAASRGQTFVNPIYCLVRFWEPCDVVGDRLAERNAPDVPVKPIEEPAPPTVDRADYRLFVQFAGYVREDVVQLARTLGEAGWQVEGASRGGERVPAAQGKAEVRYRGPAEAEAAKLLAQDISRTGVKEGVVAKQMSIIEPNTLEVWIGL